MQARKIIMDLLHEISGQSLLIKENSLIPKIQLLLLNTVPFNHKYKLKTRRTEPREKRRRGASRLCDVMNRVTVMARLAHKRRAIDAGDRLTAWHHFVVFECRCERCEVSQ